MMATTQQQNGAALPATPIPSAALVASTPEHGGAINAFGSAPAFEVAQRMARALSTSSMVPKQYQGSTGLANCMIAIELASRIGCSVFQVMQNLYIVHGKPGWSGTFLIGSVNSSGRFTPLRFRWHGVKGHDDWSCTAVAKDKNSGEECVGAAISWAMVKAEGWLNKDGSKWKTMPEQMFMYRSAAFWTRAYAPEIALGMRTVEEEEDTLPPLPFTGTIAVSTDSSPAGAIEASDVVSEFLSKIAAATSDAELKALSKDLAKHPATVGEACQAAYVARKASIKAAKAAKADPVSGEIKPSSEPIGDAHGYDANEAEAEVIAAQYDE
jgi:hypothetical protein